MINRFGFPCLNKVHCLKAFQSGTQKQALGFAIPFY